jgi:hypothetical protein
VLWLNSAMMRSLNPSFQIAENEMDHGQVRFRLVGIAAERQRIMLISNIGKSGITGPCISAYQGAKRNVLFDKAGKYSSAAVWYDSKPQASSVYTAPTRPTIMLMQPDFYGADYGRFVVSTATFAARFAADITLINFDGMFTANRIALWADHTSAKLVEYLKGRLIAGETELALKLYGRLSGRLRGHEVGTPKPRRKRRMARLHDGASRKRRIGFTSTTTQHCRRPRGETIGLAGKTALWARKALRPTNNLKITGASLIIGEYPLKLGERSGEAANVHSRDNGTFLYLCQATG